MQDKSQAKSEGLPEAQNAALPVQQASAAPGRHSQRYMRDYQQQEITGGLEVRVRKTETVLVTVLVIQLLHTQ